MNVHTNMVLKLTELQKSKLKTSLNLDMIGAKVYDEVEVDNVLVLSPHPDDDVFACGGLIKHMSKNGAHVKVVYITDGVYGNVKDKIDYDLVAKREQEAMVATKVLGVSEVNFLRVRDKGVQKNKKLWERIFEELKIRNLDLVLTPSGQDWHPDHAGTYEAFSTAYKKLRGKKPRVWQYQVWGADKVNIFFPIDKYLRYKREASAAHKSQNKVVDYVDAVIDSDSFWGKIFGTSNYAEVFWEDIN